MSTIMEAFLTSTIEDDRAAYVATRCDVDHHRYSIIPMMCGYGSGLYAVEAIRSAAGYGEQFRRMHESACFNTGSKRQFTGSMIYGGVVV